MGAEEIYVERGGGLSIKDWFVGLLSRGNVRRNPIPNGLVEVETATLANTPRS